MASKRGISVKLSENGVDLEDAPVTPRPWTGIDGDGEMSINNPVGDMTMTRDWRSRLSSRPKVKSRSG